MQSQAETQGTDTLVGGWTTYSCDISAEEMEVFKSAVTLDGVDYTPVVVASQVVSGMNYSYFCNAKGVYPGALNEAVMIDIYAPINEKPILRGITRIPR